MANQLRLTSGPNPGTAKAGRRPRRIMLNLVMVPTETESQATADKLVVQPLESSGSGSQLTCRSTLEPSLYLPVAVVTPAISHNDLHALIYPRFTLTSISFSTTRCLSLPQISMQYDVMQFVPGLKVHPGRVPLVRRQRRWSSLATVVAHLSCLE